MSYNNFSVAINLTTATRKNIKDVHRALKEIKKLDDQIDFKSFSQGIGKINWDEVLQGSEFQQMATDLEDILRMVEGLEETIEAKQAVLGPGALDELKRDIVKNFRNYGASIKAHVTMRINEMIKEIMENITSIMDKYGGDWLEKQDALLVEYFDKLTGYMDENIWQYIGNIDGKFYEMDSKFEGFPGLFRRILDDKLKTERMPTELMEEDPIVKIWNILTKSLPTLLRNLMDRVERKFDEKDETDDKFHELLMRTWGGITRLNDYLAIIQEDIHSVMGRIDVLSEFVGKAVDMATEEEYDFQEKVRAGEIFWPEPVREAIEEMEESGEDIEDLKNAFGFYNEKLKKEMVAEVKENRRFLSKIDKFLEDFDDEKESVEDAVIQDGDDEE